MTDSVPALEPQTLRVDGLTMVALTEDDAEEIAALVPGDAALARWSSVGRVTDVESARLWARSRRGPDHLEWCIRASDGSLAGRVSLHDIRAEHRVAEIGYGLFAAHRGAGLARTAVGAVTRHAFADLRLRRIELEHAVANPASCAVAQACGYQLEGTLREVLDAPDGSYDDAHLHARLASDP